MSSLDFDKIGSYLGAENKGDLLKIDTKTAHQITSEVRRINSILNGKLINQRQYCYALIKALYDHYITDIDEFVFLYLKVCIACDYKTSVITKTLLDDWIIDSIHLFKVIKSPYVPIYASNYISFKIRKEYFQRDKLVTYELFQNTKNKNIPTDGANIPLGDFQKMEDNYYQIRMSSISLIKIYFKTFYWLPEFRYRFGISPKNEIVNGLKDPEKLGREVNVWCPSLEVKNYTKLHGFVATTSMVTLHDIVHLSILSSYPKYLASVVYENTKRLTNNFSKINRLSETSLVWRLIDFSASHEGKLLRDDSLTIVFSKYIKCACKNWFIEINKQCSQYEKEKMFFDLFKDILLLIKEKNLWSINGEILIESLGFNLVSLEKFFISACCNRHPGAGG